MMRVLKVCALSLTALAMSSACAEKTEDDAARFREAIPQREEVALDVPGSASTAEGTTTKGLHLATTARPGSARYYQMTRDFTATVDVGTGLTLASIWAIVNLTPTSLEENRAVWGPGSANALEPAVWRFSVTQVGDREYDYVLEGQSKTGGPWLPVLTGHGWGKERPEHKMGWFQANHDNYRALESAWGADESGTTKVTYDLRKTPSTIDVELRPTTEGTGDIHVVHGEGGSGSITIRALADIEENQSKLEDVSIESAWSADGSGRASLVIKDGDMPVVLDATECWSSRFERVYYKDTVDYEPASGAPEACTVQP